MPNGGGDCCGMCIHNLIFDKLGPLSRQKTEEERALWYSESECGLRGIKVPYSFHTYCANFSFFNKREPFWSSRVFFWRKRSEANLNDVTEEKPRGWVFASGYSEEDCTYPRIPWDNNNEPVLGKFIGKCNKCTLEVGSGIRVFVDSGEEILFCSNSHYMDWWHEKHGDGTR